MALWLEGDVNLKVHPRDELGVIGDQGNEKEHAILYGSHKNTLFIRN